MKRVHFASIIAGICLSATAFATEGSGDPCISADPARFHPNTWSVALNADDKSSKEGIVQALKLFRTEGFHAALTHVIEPSAYYILSFNSEDVTIHGDANSVKDRTLQALSSISGTSLGCVAIRRGAPSISVGN